MKRAYANGAKKIWIANVGDIKPAEYNRKKIAYFSLMKM
ncbi:MAG TPA: glycosyl hydrolase 115 family protein [Pricia sp.]|nr:glycosyl hydrolase 115 family protein [Pricia sp.]